MTPFTSNIDEKDGKIENNVQTLKKTKVLIPSKSKDDIISLKKNPSEDEKIEVLEKGELEDEDAR